MTWEISLQCACRLASFAIAVLYYNLLLTQLVHSLVWIRPFHLLCGQKCQKPFYELQTSANLFTLTLVIPFIMRIPIFFICERSVKISDRNACKNKVRKFIEKKNQHGFRWEAEIYKTKIKQFSSGQINLYQYVQCVIYR